MVFETINLFDIDLSFWAYPRYLLRDRERAVHWLVIPNGTYVEDTVEAQIWCSTESAKAGARRRVAVAGKYASRRSGARRKSGIAAKHCNTGTVLGATVGQDILDEIVAELIASN
jgi:hypothetical protein